MALVRQKTKRLIIGRIVIRNIGGHLFLLDIEQRPGKVWGIGTRTKDR